MCKILRFTKKLNLIACDPKEMLVNKWPLQGNEHFQFLPQMVLCPALSWRKCVYKLPKLGI